LDIFLKKSGKLLLILAGILGFLLWQNGPAGTLALVTGLLQSAPFFAFQLAFAAMYMVFQFGILFWFISRPRKYTVEPGDKSHLSFNDYRGQPDLLDHAKSTVRILRGVQEFEAGGGNLPKGMLLSGAPGTGKTFLAGIIAAEAELPFIYIDASSLRGMFWGMDTMMVHKLFRDARGLGRKWAPEGKRGACIIFIDELDSIGGARGGSTSGSGMSGMMFGGGSAGLNTLLGQMDGLDNLNEDRWLRRLARGLGLLQGPIGPKPVVFVIGSTNRPEVLDTALTRPGRLDRLITVYPPDGQGRRDIIEFYLSKARHEPDLPISMMVSDSVGWTPVAIKTTINEALIKAHEAGREELTYKDWLDAADQRAMGLKQPIAGMSDADIRALAFHEAGHAVVARYASPRTRTLKATIIRTGDALGAVSRAPTEEQYTRHAADILSSIMVSLGSRAAEQVFLDSKMTGASSDLVRATSNANAYVNTYSMGTALATNEKGHPKIVEALLQEMMARTVALVEERRDAVEAVALALRSRKELIGVELDEVFAAVEEDQTAFLPASHWLRPPETLPAPFEDDSKK
jgi:cell division protease FtsH